MAVEQQEDLLVMVPYLRQYNNCSVVSVQLESPRVGYGGSVTIDLDIVGFQCQHSGGYGSEGYLAHDFTVTPIIADDQIATLDMTVRVESGPIRPRVPESEPIPPTTIRLRKK